MSGAVAAPLLTIDGLSKAFGATRALEGVTLTAHAGEVHALLGENGAGKSTLLGVLSGLSAPDAGAITLAGAPFVARTPLEAQSFGVALAPQEPTLAPHLSVAENIVLGKEPGRVGFVSDRAAAGVATAALAKVGLRIDPRRLASSLSPAEQQLVSIARALASNAVRVLILDEPTSSLAAHEVTRVLDAARAIAEAGTAVLYVSHHLAEVVRVADAFTVLRAGKTVHAGRMRDDDGAVVVGAEALAEHIVGRALSQRKRAARGAEGRPGEVVLELSDVHGVRMPRGASLQLHRGEILGLAGLVGSGRSELLRAIFGLEAVRSGKVRLKALPADEGASPHARLDAGVGLVSEDRKGEGVAQALSIADNVCLSKLEAVGRFGFVDRRVQAARTQALCDRLAVRMAGPWAPASSLSGGNQQKIAIARLLHHEVDVLLFDEPTRGIDPGSREQIYALALELAARGTSILWVASQLDELLAVADRIAVMRRGVLSPPRPASAWDEASLLAEVSEGA